MDEDRDSGDFDHLPIDVMELVSARDGDPADEGSCPSCGAGLAASDAFCRACSHSLFPSTLDNQAGGAASIPSAALSYSMSLVGESLGDGDLPEEVLNPAAPSFSPGGGAASPGGGLGAPRAPGQQVGLPWGLGASGQRWDEGRSDGELGRTAGALGPTMRPRGGRMSSDRLRSQGVRERGAQPWSGV